MKNRQTVALFVFLVVLLLFVLAITGCGGNGGSDVSPFVGGRFIGYDNGTRGGPGQDGGFELDIQKDGSFGPNGAAYAYVFDAESYENFEGDVQTGHIDRQGSFVIEALMNRTGYPLTDMEEPYYVIATGQLVLRGGHYEGQMHIDYYQWSPITGRASFPDWSADYNARSYPVTRSRK